MITSRSGRSRSRQSEAESRSLVTEHTHARRRVNLERSRVLVGEEEERFGERAARGRSQDEVGTSDTHPARESDPPPFQQIPALVT